MTDKNPPLSDKTIESIEKRYTKDSSRIAIIQRLKKLAKDMADLHTPQAHELFTDMDLIKKHFDRANYPASTRKNMAVTLQTYHVIHDGKAPDVVRELVKDSEKAYKDSQFDKQEDIPVSYDSIQQMRDSYITKLFVDDYTDLDYLKALLLSLYTTIPPIRQSEYLSIKIEDSKKDYNCLDRAGKKLHIYEYKTKATYGEKHIDVPDLVMKVIEKHPKGVNPKWLIFSPRNPDKAMNNSSLSQFAKKHFGLTTNQIYKVFFRDEFVKKGKVMDLKARDKVAKTRGSSLNMQEVAYGTASKKTISGDKVGK